jgi:hypothetical protein
MDRATDAREPFIGDLDDTWNDNDEEAGDE